jgi:ATP-dependent Lon protease
LLKVLNANLQEIKDYYLNFDIELGNILIVAATNKRFSELSDEHIPLQNRFVEIKFNDLMPEIKTQITLNYVQKQFSEVGLNFTQQDEQQIRKLIQSDSNPGVRQLLLQAQNYTSNRNSESVLFGTVWGSDKNVPVVESAASKFESSLSQRHSAKGLKRRNTM